MPFKVINVICRFNAGSGGPPRTVATISKASVGCWEAELFTTDYREGPDDPLLIDSFVGHLNVLDASAQTLLGGWVRVLKVFRSYEAQLLLGVAPKLIHLHGIWSPLLVAFASSAREHGIPYVVSPHGMLEPWSLGVRALRKSLALRLYQARLLSECAAVHATSEMEAEHLRALPFIRSPVHVVPNAVDMPDGPPQNRQRNSRTLLFMSRLHPKKGLEILLQAWYRLRPTDWKLLIAGSGDPAYVAKLQSWCSTRTLPGVQFVGQVSGRERERMFAMSTALVLPTQSENFGNVVAEALARGLPVITTTGTPWQSLIDQRCGWWVAPTVDAVARALAELFNSDDQLLWGMGARGRHYALENFTVAAIRDRLKTMYMQAALQRRPHGELPGAVTLPD